MKQECLKFFLVQLEKDDESCETVDFYTAVVCLFGIEYVHDNLTIISIRGLQKTMSRLKYMSMILRQFYFPTDEHDRSIENQITKFISKIIHNSKWSESTREQFLCLLNSLRSSVAHLRSSTTSILLVGESNTQRRLTLHLPNSLRKEDSCIHDLLSLDTRLIPNQKSCSSIYYFTELFWILEHNDNYDTQYRMAVALDTIPEYLLFRNDEDLLFVLTFVPKHLRNLFVRLLKDKLIIPSPEDPIDSTNYRLSFGHILIECLILLSNTVCKRLSLVSALVTLSPMLRVYQLENFGS